MNQIRTLRWIVLPSLAWFMMLATACRSLPAASTITPTPTTSAPTAVGTAVGTVQAGNTTAESGELVVGPALIDIVTVVAERTPLPTPTPGPVDRLVEDVAQKSGVAGRSLLGLTVEDWLNIGISILIVVASYILGVWLLFGVLRRAVRRTKTHFDDDLLNAVERELKWVVLIIVVRFATLRLELLSDRHRGLLDDLFFLLMSAAVYITSLRLIAFTADWYRETRIAEENRKRLEPILVTVRRLGYVFASIIALSIVSSHFGLEITLLSAIILFIALVVVIGARAAVSDAVSGFIILLSQPFNVDDVIYINDLDTRGVVTEIGIRSTRMRTRDGRDVIVPNSRIGSSQVVNYTDPDPSFRVEMEFLVYGGELNELDRLIEETVRGTEGVLHDRPVDILYLSFGGTARKLRVRWWVDHIFSKNRMLNRVNRALERALAEAGIDTPNPLYDLNLNPTRERKYLGDGNAHEDLK